MMKYNIKTARAFEDAELSGHFDLAKQIGEYEKTLAKLPKQKIKSAVALEILPRVATLEVGS